MTIVSVDKSVVAHDEAVRLVDAYRRTSQVNPRVEHVLCDTNELTAEMLIGATSASRFVGSTRSEQLGQTDKLIFESRFMRVYWNCHVSPPEFGRLSREFGMDPVSTVGWTCVTIGKLRQEKTGMTVYLWLRRLPNITLVRSSEIVQWRLSAGQRNDMVRTVHMLTDTLRPERDGFVRRSSRKNVALTGADAAVLDMSTKNISPPGTASVVTPKTKKGEKKKSAKGTPINASTLTPPARVSARARDAIRAEAKKAKQRDKAISKELKDKDSKQKELERQKESKEKDAKQKELERQKELKEKDAKQKEESKEKDANQKELVRLKELEQKELRQMKKLKDANKLKDDKHQQMPATIPITPLVSVHVPSASNSEMLLNRLSEHATLLAAMQAKDSKREMQYLELIATMQSSLLPAHPPVNPASVAQTLTNLEEQAKKMNDVLHNNQTSSPQNALAVKQMEVIAALTRRNEAAEMMKKMKKEARKKATKRLLDVKATKERWKDKQKKKKLEVEAAQKALDIHSRSNEIISHHHPFYSS